MEGRAPTVLEVGTGDASCALISCTFPQEPFPCHELGYSSSSSNSLNMAAGCCYCCCLLITTSGSLLWYSWAMQNNTSTITKHDEINYCLSPSGVRALHRWPQTELAFLFSNSADLSDNHSNTNWTVHTKKKKSVRDRGSRHKCVVRMSLINFMHETEYLSNSCSPPPPLHPEASAFLAIPKKQPVHSNDKLLLQCTWWSPDILGILPWSSFTTTHRNRTAFFSSPGWQHKVNTSSTAEQCPSLSWGCAVKAEFASSGTWESQPLHR